MQHLHKRRESCLHVATLATRRFQRRPKETKTRRGRQSASRLRFDCLRRRRREMIIWHRKVACSWRLLASACRRLLQPLILIALTHSNTQCSVRLVYYHEAALAEFARGRAGCRLAVSEQAKLCACSICLIKKRRARVLLD